jgi:uncharacterized protein DUF6010
MSHLIGKLRSVPQRSDALRPDDGPGTGAALLGGAALGVATDAVLARLPREKARLLAGLALATAGGAYLGFGVADGRRTALLVQSGEFLAFGAVAYLGVQRDSPALLGGGWLAHAAWDVLHHRGGGPTRVRPWYPPACAGYDAAVGVPLLTGRL